MSRLGSIGVVGTGKLGLCFVERLVSAGREVHAYDIDPAARVRAKDAGAHIEASPAEVAASCATVLICVTGPDQVRGCSLGLHGLRDGLNSDDLVIDMSTSLPGTTKEVARSLAERGIRFIDAPVSRGIPAAQAGTLSIMVGAEAPHTVELAMPVLKLLGTDIVRVGGLGDGNAVKLLNMMLMGAHLVAVAEALGLAAAHGANAQTMVEATDRAGGTSYMTSNHLPRYVLSRSYSSGFSLKLMAKDLGLGRTLADALAVPIPLTDRVCHVYSSALHILGDVDNMRLVPFVASLAAGTDVQQARANALSGCLPDPESVNNSSLSEISSLVTNSNALAAREASWIAKACKLSFRTAFSVIDMSSGASGFTSRLADGAFPPSDAPAGTRPPSAFPGRWTPVLSWAAMLGNIAPRWSYTTSVEAADGLFDFATGQPGAAFLKGGHSSEAATP